MRRAAAPCRRRSVALAASPLLPPSINNLNSSGAPICDKGMAGKEHRAAATTVISPRKTPLAWASATDTKPWLSSCCPLGAAAALTAGEATVTAVVRIGSWGSAPQARKKSTTCAQGDAPLLDERRGDTVEEEEAALEGGSSRAESPLRRMESQLDARRLTAQCKQRGRSNRASSIRV